MKIFVSTSLALSSLALASAQVPQVPADVAVLMNTKVSPCDDFYQYSCGAWLKKTQIPGSDDKIAFMKSQIKARNEKIIQQIGEEGKPIFGAFWDACVALDKIDKVGAAPLQKGLKRISGLKTVAELLEIAGEHSRTGPDFMASFHVSEDIKNPKQNEIHVGSSSLEIDYMDPETIAVTEPAYRTYIAKLAKLAGLTNDTTAFVNTIISVEKKIAALQSSTLEESYFPLTVKEAAKKYPLTIGAYGKGLGLTQKTPKGENTKLIFSSLDYCDLAEKLLNSLNVNDLKVYLSFHFVHGRWYTLGNPFLKAYFDLEDKINPTRAVRLPREQWCVSRSFEMLPDLIGSYYAEKAFGAKQQADIELLVQLTEKAMSGRIAKASWLDDATRNEAQIKLSKVFNLLGSSTIKKDYPQLSSDDHYGNVEKILSAGRGDGMLRRAGTKVDRNDWEASAADMRAYYYYGVENKLVFPASILQAPYFSSSALPAQNFGAIGAKIGSELTYGFDSDGRRYDGEGNKRNWWTDATAAEFEKRAKCVKAQYSEIKVAGDESGKPFGFVNGTLTIKDNIADNGGFGLAWDAYKAYLAKGGAAPTTPGKVDGDKLFYISYGQSLCTKYRDQVKQQMLKTDSSPAEARVNGVIMNDPRFGKIFQCAAGTKMNPTKKCQVW